MLWHSPYDCYAILYESVTTCAFCLATVIRSRALSSQSVSATAFTLRPDFLSGLAVGVVLAALLAILARSRLKALRSELQCANELADHRERERDLAQCELVRGLEEERELVKQKLQFDSQLAEYEKYASLAQLALGAAHEINNPLLGIMSHLELERKQSTGEQRAEIEQCIESTKRISTAVRGLLDYARPGPLVLGQVNLFKLVAEALKFVEHQPMFRNLTLSNRIPLDFPLLTADANQLSQVLMNLLLNAAQATPPGGLINVSASLQSSQMIELQVTDSGSGIPADVLPHIFEPFFTTKRGKGTGLGLSISQSHIRSHAGDICVESTVGVGTTVRITLPMHPAGMPQTEYQEVIA